MYRLDKNGKLAGWLEEQDSGLWESCAIHKDGTMAIRMFELKADATIDLVKRTRGCTDGGSLFE